MCQLKSFISSSWGEKRTQELERWVLTTSSRQERIRIPEVLYQPCMVGEDQMGLSESIQQVLSAFLPEVQTALVNVSLNFGCLEKRI